MWDEDPDFLDVLEEHDFEHESDGDSADLEHELDIEDMTEEDIFDEHSEYLDCDR